MTFSAVPDVLKVPDAMAYIRHLGYPDYFVPFIGVAKILGSLAILVPSFYKLKEWAYAGLCFDLVAAVYSILMTDGFDPGMLMMIPIFGIAAISYLLNGKVNSRPQ